MTLSENNVVKIFGVQFKLYFLKRTRCGRYTGLEGPESERLPGERRPITIHRRRPWKISIAARLKR